MRKIFNFIKNQKGATMVEMLIYMAILTILLTILTSIFTSALDVQSESNATSAVEQDGNFILARLGYDIHRAQNIVTPASNGIINNNFEIIIDGVNYLYRVDSNDNLIFSNNLTANNLNNYNTSISNFSIQRLGNIGGVEDTLKISFTVTSRERRISGLETKNFQTTLSLRRQ